jgi:hypothetical protein
MFAAIRRAFFREQLGCRPREKERRHLTQPESDQ